MKPICVKPRILAIVTVSVATVMIFMTKQSFFIGLEQRWNTFEANRTLEKEISGGKDVSSQLSEISTYSSTGLTATRKHELEHSPENSLLAGAEHTGLTAARNNELEHNQTKNPSLAGAEHNEIKENERKPDALKYTNFTRMKFGPVYVLGVAVGNSSKTARWDTLKVYASVHKDTPTTGLFCCVKYRQVHGSGYDYKKQPISTAAQPNPPSELTSFHYTCSNPRPGIIPDGIAVTVGHYTCGEEHVVYRKPFLPLRESETKLALCSKMAYGNRNAEMILEWLETYKHLGVDKVVAYFLKNLNWEARKVLEYYASTGFVDLYLYKPASEDTVKRQHHPPDQQSASDKQMLLFDSFEKMFGYSYFGVIDYDEFLIPPNGWNFKEYLAYLYKKYKDAAGFTFALEHYFLDWGQHGTSGDMILQRYITRSTQGPIFYAQKNIFKPTNIKPGQIQTHVPVPIQGLRMVKLRKKEGFIRHYRDCYDRYCVRSTQRKNDPWTAEWSKRIEKNVKNVRQRLFGSRNAI